MEDFGKDSSSDRSSWNPLWHNTTQMLFIAHNNIKDTIKCDIKYGARQGD